MLGIWLVLIADAEAYFVQMAFPAAMFLTQAAALAIVRRNSPWLIPLGITCTALASYLAFGEFRRALTPDSAAIIFGGITAIAWAAALSRRWFHAPAWLAVGAGALVIALHAIKNMDGPYVGSLSLGAIVGALTTPMVWWSCRAPAPPRAPHPRDRITPTRAQRLTGAIILRTVGALLIVLAGAIVLGWLNTEPAPSPQDPDLFRPPPANRYPGNAMDLGALNPILAALCLIVGLALVLKANWARYAIHLAAPAGALALASVHAHRLWQNDLPLTMLMGLPFGVLVILLAREPAILAATGRPDGAPSTRVRRAIPWSLAVLLAAFTAYLIVQHNPPPRRQSLIAALESRNTWVKHMAITHLFMWHAIPGAIGALVPPFRRRARPQPPAPNAP